MMRWLDFIVPGRGGAAKNAGRPAALANSSAGPGRTDRSENSALITAMHAGLHRNPGAGGFIGDPDQAQSVFKRVAESGPLPAARGLRG